MALWFLPAAAQAQEEAPSYDLSIGLHVGAAIAGPAGTAMVVLGGLTGAAASIGGGDGGVGVGIALGGGGLLAISLTLGICASAVHANTRSRIERLSVLPVPWLDPRGGGGLSLLALF